ncbi:DUF4190 domain-containing protein [Brachybacterium vulturis]|nr:DUF4190 domain-containing protein [Brachybacterium vulturis]
MNAEHDDGLPDHSGGYDPYGQRRGHHDDPSGVGYGVTDPYASDPHAADPYASGPYATGPHPAGPVPVGPPQFGAFPAPLPSSNAAITGFVLGLLGLAMCGGLTSPIGIWFSARGMKETAPTATAPRGGRGLAIAGLVTSLVGLIPLCFLLLYGVMMIVGLVMAATA